MGFKTHIIRKVGIMFGILLITMLLTISLVGSNMDYILKQGVAFQIRSELSSDPRISASFSDHAELEEYIKSKIAEREKILGLDKPWYSPQRIGYAMYNIITLDFGQAVFLTSDAGSSDVLEILAEKLPRTVLALLALPIIKLRTRYDHEPNPIRTIVASGKTIWYASDR